MLTPFDIASHPAGRTARVLTGIAAIVLVTILSVTLPGAAQLFGLIAIYTGGLALMLRCLIPRSAD